MKEKLKKMQIEFVGDVGWEKFRDLIVLKLIEATSEEELTFVIKAMLGSMFSSAKEIDEARKKARLELLTEQEKHRINKLEKEKGVANEI